MQNSKMGQVLLYGEANNRIKEIERILKRHSLGVKRVSETGRHMIPDQRDHFSLIMVTDSIKDKVDKNYIADLRRFFPLAKFLCLFDEINPQIEMNLRSAGVIFLGSYDHFIRESSDILAAALRSKKTKNKFRKLGAGEK